MNEEIEILIVGAGATGLMAALELAKAGKNIKVLEAQARAGGRIHTVSDAFNNIIEGGAEFIHGNLPITINLLKKADISYYPVAGKAWRVDQGIFKQQEEFVEHWDEMIEKLKELKSDMTVQKFLDLYFPEAKYKSLHTSLKKFVEGYDLADANRASVLALREEWIKEEESDDYRIKGGYIKLIEYLIEECKRHQVSFEFSTIVKKVCWNEHIEVTCDKGKIFHSKKILVTVPAGILCLDANEKAAIKFDPPIDEKIKAIKNIGYGSVIKIFLDFKTAFWKDLRKNKNINLDDLQFLFSDEAIPTWWTQYPENSTSLTGWLGGKDVELLKKSDEKILDLALQSLSNIFTINKNELKLNSYAIFNWSADPFSRGAYSYPTIAATEIKRIMNTPEQDILFFAGEAINEGKEFGTVEAALSSGLNTAKKILGNSVSF